MLYGPISEQGLKNHYTAVKQRLGLTKRRQTRATKVAGVHYEYRAINHREREYLVISKRREPEARVLDVDSSDFMPRWRQIILETAATSGVSEGAMLSHTRKAEVIRARQEAVYRVYHETTLSMIQIASKFGYRDHTVIGHSVRKHAERLAREGKLQ